MIAYWIICAVVWLFAFVYAQNEPRFIGSPIKEQIYNLLTASTIALLWPLGLVVLLGVVILGKIKSN